MDHPCGRAAVHYPNISWIEFSRPILHHTAAQLSRSIFLVLGRVTPLTSIASFVQAPTTPTGGRCVVALSVAAIPIESRRLDEIAA